MVAKTPVQSQVKAHAYFGWPDFKLMLHPVTCYMTMLCQYLELYNEKNIVLS